MKALLVFTVFVTTTVCALAQAHVKLESYPGDWYASFMSDEQVGYIHELYEHIGNEHRLCSSNRIALRRGTTAAEVTVESSSGKAHFLAGLRQLTSEVSRKLRSGVIY